MKNKFFIFYLLFFVCGCVQNAANRAEQMPLYDTVNVIDNLVVDENSVPIFPKKAALTTDTARRFALDLPKRCRVDWENQKVLSVVAKQSATVARLNAGDPLPEMTVNDYEWKKLTIKEVLDKLLDGTDIAVVEDESLPSKISGNVGSAKLSDAVDLITKMGRAYYSYDADAQELHLFNRADFLMKMPDDTDTILALVDAMRGVRMRNLLVNWEDKTLEFSGDWQAEKEVARLAIDIASKKYMVAYDVNVYRVYPKTDNPIIWQNIIPAIGEKNIKMSVPGVVGRALLTSAAVNTKTLEDFLAQQSNVVLVSQGSFVVPNDWQTRFDVGQCSREERLETDLSIGADAKFGDYGGMQRVESKIVLRTRAGQIAEYKIPSKLGDNYVIIGIPTHTFVDTPETLISPFAEMVVFVSPRVVQMLDLPSESSSAPLSGDALRNYLSE
ncbi:MAG: hypothetical protein LBO08_03030 [Rickettsiales bacterium]|jgi:hypothetical protein|nr:hypothetical protein [Rickettsiales bacterium]